MEIRPLSESDSPRLEQYLSRYPATTMFLRSNLRRASMATPPVERFEGTYVGVLQGETLVGVAAHYWNGMLLMQADAGLEEAARLAVDTSGKKLHGLIGDLPQVETLAAAFRLPAPTRDATEYLYELALEDLAVPDLLGRDNVVCRRPKAEDFDLMVQWRAGYSAETLNNTSSSPDEHVRRAIDGDDTRLLTVDGEPVSHTAFNAALPDIVQIGGVWTPPELRGRGYARAAVAGHLLDARTQGVEQAILFTGHDNVAAQRAYEAIGFQRIGEFGLLLLDEPVEL